MCDPFSKEDVEKCKQKDLLEQTMSEMIGEFPALHQTIVAERDIYLTHTLRQATRCVEAPHNSQSNYCRYFSCIHPDLGSAFADICLLMCLSVCKQHYTLLHFKTNTETDLKKEIFKKNNGGC